MLIFPILIFDFRELRFSTSEEYDSGDAGEGTSSGPKKIKYSQKYKKSWENEVNFEGWLKQGKTEQETMCTVCDKKILIGSMGKSRLLRHSETATHIRLLKSQRKQPTIFSLKGFKSTSNLDESVKKANLHLAAFVSEHNLSYNLMEHLPNLISKICPDSEIAKAIKCSRTKCSCIVKNVIGRENELNLCNILKTSKFSLIIDESTDRSCTKHLALVCRFYYNEK